MANEEHVKILKQGVEVWNKWRNENPDIKPDLSKAELKGFDLNDAELSLADLRGANLISANLIGTDLSFANLSYARLTKSDLNMALLWETIFGNVDLSKTLNLDKCGFVGQCIIDQRTLQKSGNLPIQFLRGIGLSDIFIDHIPALFLDQAIQFYSCFISYSSKDEKFAKRLHADLQDKGIRCWFAPEDIKIGDKIRHRIDEAIRMHDKLLLILSTNSIESNWVEAEVENAIEKEGKTKEPVLFPIRLDETVMESQTAWAAHIKRTRHIGDFKNWKEHDNYQKAFERLLRDLKQSEEKL